MSKKSSILFVLIILILFVSYPKEIVKANNEEINIKIEDNNKGNSSFSYLENDTTITSTDATVKKGTKITLYTIPNSEYKFGGWIYYINDRIYLLSTNETVVITVNMSYTFTPFYVSKQNHIVKFYDNTDLSKAKLLSIQEVETGSDAKIDFSVPKKAGYKSSFDKSYKNVTEDLVICVDYNATIFHVFIAYHQDFFGGLLITLLLSIVSVFLAMFLGLGLCFLKLSKNKVFSFLASSYIEVIRGVPLLLQLLLIYAIVPRVSIELGSLTLSNEVLSCILALFLNSGAYVAEIFRSGIQSVDKGQMEAARALGLTKNQTMRKIIVPQGLKNSLPSLANELIAVIKETSLASTVDKGIGELMSVKDSITSATFINIEPFIIIAILYFIVTFSLSKGVRLIERKIDARD